ncbi:hypothetical protein Dimus_012321 [Dionaea muscipula]
MDTKEHSGKPLPELVTLDHAFQLAEQWVKNMSGDWQEEETQVKLEGRPPGLGLGAILPRKSNPVPTNNPVERKLKSMLRANIRTREADDAEVSAGNNNDDDDDDDDNEESRTKVFAKKRGPPSSLTNAVVPETGRKKKSK